MNDATITLKDFFGLQELKLDEAQLKAAASGEAAKAIEATLVKFPGVGWRTVADGMEKALAETFNIGLAELLAATWQGE